MLKYINEMDCNKSSGDKILAKIIKMSEEEITVPITNCINKCISLSIFTKTVRIQKRAFFNALSNLLKNWYKCSDTP